MSRTFPDAPGVYFFKDKNQAIIYVGKANSIKHRISSYFQKNNGDWKVQALLQEHNAIDYLLTKNEAEALILEAQLIKEHQPKYNVLLKSGQPFVYILFSNAPVPEMKLVRNKKDKGTYFGPFIHKMAARKVFKFLEHTFQLARCNQKLENGCLRYHLGFCAGSCKKDFDLPGYLFRLELTIDVLKKDHASCIKKIKAKIQEYNQALEFEKARNFHEYLINLDRIFDVIKTRFNEEKFLPAIYTITTPFVPDYETDNISQELQMFLKRDNPVVTVDCFDISHFQSRSIVGSCVRFTHGKPDKNSFRRFRVLTLEQQNDYAALQEIVSRRYKNREELPDLILIDGGKGQRNAVKDLVGQTRCVSLAKKEEIIYGDTYPDGVRLDIKTPVGKFFIALRDYAHHFAISYHKKRRSKQLKE